MLAVFGVVANPTPTTFNWDIPTETIDGDPLDVSSIAGYQLYQDGSPVLYIEGGSTTTVGYDVVGFGNICFTISTIDVFEQEGPQSEPVCETYFPSFAKSPSGLSVSK